MAIPKIVKVAGVTYTVEEKDVVIIDGNANYAGLCDYKDARIEILKEMNSERKEETFVHELFHAVLNEAGFDDHDEELVSRASRVLYQMLKDNHFSFGGTVIETDQGDKYILY